MKSQAITVRKWGEVDNPAKQDARELKKKSLWDRKIEMDRGVVSYYEVAFFKPVIF